MITRRKTWLAAGATAVAALVAVSGCSSSSTKADSKPPSSITFWGWAPGYADAVKAFDAGHHGFTVNYQEIQPGAKGGYQKLLNAVKADNAPCLAQVGYETLPSFAAQGALDDVSSLADSSKNEFQPAAWSSVTVAGRVYGAPVDTGPMGMFYNKKLLDSLGLKPPTTWAEYAAAAAKIHASAPDRYISSPYLDYDYAGFAWQAGAPWFGIDGQSWKVTMNSSANQKVADYWQGLVKKGYISSAPMYDQAWYNGLSSGKIATVVGAVWQGGVIKGGAKGGSGDWAVAPMPQWSAGQTAVGNVGGSSTAVLKGCASDKEAWDFAHWMSTDKSAFTGLIKSASLYPAATSLLDLPILSQGDPYFGGQKVFDVFAAASKSVNPGWVWGPSMTTTASALDDGLGSAWAGTSTISQALSGAQSRTVSEMKSQGISVSS